MRKIDLVPYTYESGADAPAIVINVRDFLPQVLCHPSLNLEGLQLLERNDVRLKIRNAAGDSVLLEEAEWKKLDEAVRRVKGFGEAFMELFLRVRDAEKVEVEPVTKAAPPPA